MKNASKYADEAKGLFKKLLREGKPEVRASTEPLRTLVRAAMSFDVGDSRVDEVMKVIDKEFVDLNELRVATDLEVQELLGTKYPAIERRVALITQSLNAIFEREHTLSLDRLKAISKKDARQFLRELPDPHPFVEASVMLLALDSPAIPLDDSMLAYLKDNDIMSEVESLEEAQRFLENHMKAEDYHDFFVLVRRAALKAGYSGDDEGKVKKKK